MNHVASLAEVSTDAGIVDAWLADFEATLAEGSARGLSSPFTDECHWRDMFAFTWTISPFEGRTAIVEQLLANQMRVQADG